METRGHTVFCIWKGPHLFGDSIEGRIRDVRAAGTYNDFVGLFSLDGVNVLRITVPLAGLYTENG